MGLTRQHHKGKKKDKFELCDCGGCDVCDCDLCDLGLFSLFRLSSVLLAVAAIAPRRTRSADRIGLAAIRGYQRWVSPKLGIRCPHTPSCSRYGATAIDRHGLSDGLRLTSERLRRCNRSVARGTVDPVP